MMCENLSKIDISARRAIEMFSEHVGQESSGEVHSFFPECPRVSMPDISMPQRKAITNSMNGWLEELLSSSRNIEILAERSLGKGDADLRIREMTSEEEASLKKYAGITDNLMFLRRHLTVSYKTLSSSLTFSIFSKQIFFFFWVLHSVLLLNDVAQFYLPTLRSGLAHTQH